MKVITDETFPKSLQSRKRSTERAVKAERVQEVLRYARANPGLEKRELRNWIQNRFNVGRAESYSYIRAAAKAAAEMQRQLSPVPGQPDRHQQPNNQVVQSGQCNETPHTESDRPALET